MSGTNPESGPVLLGDMPLGVRIVGLLRIACFCMGMVRGGCVEHLEFVESWAAFGPVSPYCVEGVYLETESGLRSKVSWPGGPGRRGCFIGFSSWACVGIRTAVRHPPASVHLRSTEDVRKMF